MKKTSHKSELINARGNSSKSGSKTVKVYDAGGGSGRTNLDYCSLRARQLEMFKRTYNITPIEIANMEQERRQTKLVDEIITFSINVSREDFPSKSADVTISYPSSAPQSEWQNLLVKIRKVLSLEFIEDIIDRMDNAVVHRILRLRPGGMYFVRQRETSAVLEVINTGVIPEQISWESTKAINQIKEHVQIEDAVFPKFSNRVTTLIERPMTRLHEVDTIKFILAAKQPYEVFDAIEDIMYDVLVEIPEESKQVPEEVVPVEDSRARKRREKEKKKQEQELSEEAKRELRKTAMRKNRTHNKDIDVVTIYRIALESLVRVVLHHESPMEIAEECFTFAHEMFDRYANELDIMVFMVKLVSELIPYLVVSREKLLYLVMELVQMNAPDAPAHRRRTKPKRNNKPPPDPAELQAAAELEAKQLLMQQQLVDQQKQSLVLPSIGNRGKPKNSIDDDNDTDEKDDEDDFDDQDDYPKPASGVAGATADSENVKRWSGTKGGLGQKAKKRNFESKWSMKSMTSSVGNNAMLHSSTLPSINSGNNRFTAANFNGTGFVEDDADKTQMMLEMHSGFHRSFGRNIGMFDENGTLMERLPYKSKHHTLEIRAPGATFRGYSAKMQQDKLLIQAIACVYRAVSFHFAYRDAAFTMFIHEEASAIVQSCQGLPKVLEYYVWIIDSMYSDGFDSNDDEELGSDPFTMQVSSTDMSQSNPLQDSSLQSLSLYHNEPSISIDKASNEDQLVGEDGSMTGAIIEAVSIVTMPSLDINYVNMEKSPHINLGDLSTLKKVSGDEIITSDRPTEGVDDPYGESIVALAPSNPAKAQLGKDVYEKRYHSMPPDIVVVSMSLVAHHFEVDEPQRNIAKKWLVQWDDASEEFKRWTIVGKGLSNA